MLGGFLGAGKTTTVLRAAQHFQRHGLRVGLITNDQAQGLVDTALLEELDLPVEEIAGGCFCCRSEGLVDALQRLSAESQPEVFIAEPVGSCTDLVATVSLPLQSIYQQGYRMAPYVVLVDPYRAMQTLGVEGAPVFSPDVNYIYRKQLEEAEVIAINKVDVLPRERLAKLREALELQYPEAQVIEIASRPGLGMEALFEALSAEARPTSRIMEVDYARYGVGEALLGWVNVQAALEPAKKRSRPGVMSTLRNAWLLRLSKDIQSALKRRRIEIAHLKLSLAGPGQELCAVQLASSAAEPELTRDSAAAFAESKLLINLRAEGDPDVLLAAVAKALVRAVESVPTLKLSHVRTEHFRPAQPVPTHRVANLT
jgi:G3E family GTPase